MLKCRQKWIDNPGNYKALSRQCTEFVRECLKECGESGGKGNSPFPRDLIDGLPRPERCIDLTGGACESRK